MDKDKIIQTLILLTQAAGVSGDEQEPAAVAAGCLEPYVTRLHRDLSGNLIGFKEGAGGLEAPSLLIAAHIDEIGAMVTKIDRGFIRFTPVGGLDPRTLLGQAVEVHGRQRLKGVIGARPPHLLTRKERQQELKIEDLYIDLGLEQEQASRQVQVGDYISLDQPLLVMAAGDCLAGKALDNRSGVASLIFCAAELAEVRHYCHVYFVATVQEEVGVRGAITASYGLAPDLAVAVDVTHGLAPGIPEEDGFELGGGPVIGIGPNFHPVLVEQLKVLAREHHLPYQVEPVPGPASTDSRAIQISREGIPSTLLSIPLRYMHSTVEMLNADDLLLTGRLLGYFARSIDLSLVEGLKCI
ncbi:MAG TPA: M42 family metallopeptidase [Firmicutes bacterium]|nr:M42 family metallopeptidase [Bacillota bacterium]